MNEVYSARKYQLTTGAASMKHGKCTNDDLLPSDVSGAVALPGDRPATSGLSARTTGEVMGINCVFPMATSNVAEQVVSSRVIQEEGRNRKGPERLEISWDSSRASDNYSLEIQEAIDELEKELTDEPGNCIYQNADHRRNCVIARTVDCLNMLGIEVVKLTTDKDVNVSVSRLSEVNFLTEEVPQILKGDHKKKEKAEVMSSHNVYNRVMSLLREALAGLGINAPKGLTGSDLQRMGMNPADVTVKPFKRKFTHILTLRVAVAMIRALKAQIDQLMLNRSDTSRINSSQDAACPEVSCDDQ